MYLIIKAIVVRVVTFQLVSFVRNCVDIELLSNYENNDSKQSSVHSKNIF